MVLLCAATLLAALVATDAAAEKAKQPPHIFMVIVDDFGCTSREREGEREQRENREREQQLISLMRQYLIRLLSAIIAGGEVGYHRETPTAEVVTPTIDALVSQGIDLNRHYVHMMVLLLIIIIAVSISHQYHFFVPSIVSAHPPEAHS